MPNISFDFNFWIFLFSLLNFGFTVYVLITARSSALVTKIHGLEIDVATIKANQANAINHADLSNVYKRLEELSQSVNKLIGKLDQPVNTVKPWWNR